MIVRFRALLMALLLTSTITGCAPDIGIIPVGEVTVYKKADGPEVLGVASNPLPVKKVVYLNKADYVVKVEYQGRCGYVRGGAFHLSRK
ncbi:hypothetical protein LZZ50_07685 [Xanthomonas arboricola]|uniref:hypothetical protein n=1 Tax=Xanthomonas arboricola TaxID=56448 RepID=UPI001FD6CF24|nr:hypothetical protein [Xanthomonas arboricola]UOT00204.1 hypothetical protein LZZ50_07685 [Xanthomonas arboricola]